jgi:predicted dehydrogenase
MSAEHFEIRAVDGASSLPRQGGGLRVAVVGCGDGGSKHVRVLSGLRDVDLVAIVDPEPRISAQMVAVFPACRTFPDLRSAIPHVDAVVIATPADSHGELALTALRNGKHVLVEKPLTPSVAEARLLVEEATRRERVLMTGHTFLFNPAVRELRRRIVAGELGEVYYIYSARLNLGLYRRDVNVVWDLAPHDITIMNYLLGAVPSTVSAWGATLACTDVEDVAYIRLDYRQLNVSGFVQVSWLDPRKARTVTIVGREKMAVYDDLADERLRIYDRGVEGTTGARAYERPVGYRYGDIVSPHISSEEPLSLQDQHFVDCIRYGLMPESSGVSGMEVIAILEAIDRSLREGRPVDVDYPSALAAPTAAPILARRPRKSRAGDMSGQPRREALVDPPPTDPIVAPRAPKGHTAEMFRPPRRAGPTDAIVALRPRKCRGGDLSSQPRRAGLIDDAPPAELIVAPRPPEVRDEGMSGPPCPAGLLDRALTDATVAPRPPKDRAGDMSVSPRPAGFDGALAPLNPAVGEEEIRAGSDVRVEP